MLAPCNPCVCPGAPCEQCAFGYQSAESKHNMMKRLILAYIAGERPNGWRCAETYMRYHPDWKKDTNPVDKSKKQIFITNGMARCGKDTFAEFLNEIVSTLKYSSIDKVKIIARMCGWDGGKTEKDRKFLSDLKMLTSEYSDMAFADIRKKIFEFLDKDFEHQVLLIDIREPEEVERVKKAFGAKTILINNENVKIINSNPADANVFNYEYDFIIDNSSTLEAFKNEVQKFAEENILK